MITVLTVVIKKKNTAAILTGSGWLIKKNCWKNQQIIYIPYTCTLP